MTSIRIRTADFSHLSSWLSVAVLVVFFVLMTGAACTAEETSQAEALDQPNLDEPRSILFIAGAPSHSFGAHEHHAGSELLQQTLDNSVVDVQTEISYGWPEGDDAFDDVDAVVIYADGGAGHPVMDHLDEFDAVMDRGVGLVALHYAVEVPADEGGPQFHDWIGGHYETYYSVNPIWTAEYTSFPNHPITRGVEPFSVEDEWYFNMRFRPEMEDVVSILQATPSDDTRDGPYVHPQGPYDHIVEAKGESETMAWAMERDDGGRGFGFTGGHFHWNWGDDNFRRTVANAILWTAHVDVPENGVQITSVTARELAEMIDEPIPEDWDEQEIQDRLDTANRSSAY